MLVCLSRQRPRLRHRCRTRWIRKTWPCLHLLRRSQRARRRPHLAHLCLLSRSLAVLHRGKLCRLFLHTGSAFSPECPSLTRCFLAFIRISFALFGNASHSSEWADSPARLSSYLLRSYSTRLQNHFASDPSRGHNAEHSPLRVDFHPHDVDGSEANINTMWGTPLIGAGNDLFIAGYPR